MNRIHSALFAAFASLLALASPSCRREEADAVDLVPATPLLAAPHEGDRNRYTFHLKAGQYFEVTVEQEELDVTVKLTDPDGEDLLAVDSFLEATGVERLLGIAEKPGAYTVEIGVGKGYPGGRSIVKLEEPRRADDRDLERVEAATAFYRAQSAALAGDLDAAVERYEESIERWSLVGDSTWQAESHFALAIVHHYRRRGEVAIPHYKQAIRLADHDPSLRALAHTTLGELYEDSGDLGEARRHLERALELWEVVSFRKRKAFAMSRLGLVYKRLREARKALAQYEHALGIYRELGDPVNEAQVLHNIAAVYLYQRRNEAAYEYLRQERAIWEELGDRPRDLAAALTLTGYVQATRGEIGEARATLAAALDLRVSGTDRAKVLSVLGVVASREGDLERALELFREALTAFRQAGDVRNEAIVLQHLARLQDASHPVRAERIYERVLALARERQDEDSIAAALLGLARTERARGDLGKAKEYAEQALELVEDLRREPPYDIPRPTYFASKREYFDLYVDVLMSLHQAESGQGYDALALAASEQARSRSLLDALADGGIAYGGPRRVPTLSVAEIRQHLLAEETVPAEKTVLAKKTVLLEYHLGRERSFLWLVDSDSVTSFVLPGISELEPLTIQVAELLKEGYALSQRTLLENSLARASEILLGPLGDRLSSAKKVVLVAEGALVRIPFAALFLPGSQTGDGARVPLSARCEVVNLPSASLLARLRERYSEREEPSKLLAVLADPVLSREDPRVSPARNANGKIPPGATVRAVVENYVPRRLPFTAREAMAISELAGNGAHLTALGFEATKEVATSDALEHYRYVHIATHGYIDADFPQDSYLVLSLYDRQGREIDGLLHTEEVYRLDLNAELVVLSACNTALGKDSWGDGMGGWIHGFLYSGAKRVLVSLWPVDDEATAELMKHLYENLLADHVPPSTALRRAQEALRRLPGRESPYYWAGFALYGEFS